MHVWWNINTPLNCHSTHILVKLCFYFRNHHFFCQQHDLLILHLKLLCGTKKERESVKVQVALRESGFANLVTSTPNTTVNIITNKACTTAKLVTSMLHNPIFSHIFPEKSVQNTGLFIISRNISQNWCNEWQKGLQHATHT